MQARQCFLNLLATRGGNDSACKELGEIYESGRGSEVSKNTTLANEAYNKCCDLDPSGSDCCSAVGREAKPRRVLKAPERPKDSEELVTAAKECQEGSAEQCEKAFGLYQEDRHSEKFKASSKGCELGSAVLCEEAGLAYVRGHGVQQDQGTAAQFFLKACNANNVSACARIGVMAIDMGNVDAARRY
nr:hypothetical protein [uncultured Campylobacter sp.]